MRTRVVVGTAAGALAAVLVAGCGSGGTTTTKAAESSSAPPKPTTTVATPSSSAPAAPELSVDMTIQQDGLALLTFTDKGRAPVTVQGWPAIGFRNAADQAVPVPVKQVPVPGAGPSITIQPGRTAFAGMRWTDGDKADPSSHVVTTITYTPPGGSPVVVHVIGVDGKPVADPELDLKSVQVGTIQPSSEGVLVF